MHEKWARTTCACAAQTTSVVLVANEQTRYWLADMYVEQSQVPGIPASAVGQNPCLPMYNLHSMDLKQSVASADEFMMEFHASSYR